ncbi:tyrosine--tRNA ligase [Mycoplasma suis]|uniref:tyrosine--tRNA ligase n=1 Tax=Mycoplasma suis TaxID=57372 RepID=UPI001E463F76|nr:tyrosine--tRNA ligase [Mycoplasma suis]
MYNSTPLDNLKTLLDSGHGIYLGFDLTASSLHWGHYLLMLVLNKASDYGIKTVIILGDFTTKIGDASWRTEDRKILESSVIQSNLEQIREQFKVLCPKSEIVLNSTFYRNFSIEMMSDLMKNFKLSTLLSKDFLSVRLSQDSLTLRDAFYPVLQSFDFYNLAVDKNVTIQMGGQDQWGNITTGIEFIKKKDNSIPTGGFTIPLLTDSNGVKFGKSGKNTLFLNSKLTSPYKVYQYFWNLSDEKLKELSIFLFDSEIDSYESMTPECKSKIIEKLFSGVYRDNSFRAIKKASELLFQKNSDIREKVFTEEDLKDLSSVLPFYETSGPTNISTILVNLGFSSSHSESKRLVELEKCVSCFSYVFKNHKEILDTKLSSSSYFLIKKGEKEYGIFHYSGE